MGKFIKINWKAVEKVLRWTQEQDFLGLTFEGWQPKISWLEVCHPNICLDLSLSVPAQPVPPPSGEMFPRVEGKVSADVSSS